jgi:hypothetical protein
MRLEAKPTTASVVAIDDGRPSRRALGFRRSSFERVVRLFLLGAFLTLCTSGCATDRPADKSADNGQPKTITDFVGKPRPAF